MCVRDNSLRVRPQTKPPNQTSQTNRYPPDLQSFPQGQTPGEERGQENVGSRKELVNVTPKYKCNYKNVIWTVARSNPEVTPESPKANCVSQPFFILQGGKRYAALSLALDVRIESTMGICAVRRAPPSPRATGVSVLACALVLAIGTSITTSVCNDDVLLHEVCEVCEVILEGVCAPCVFPCLLGGGSCVGVVGASLHLLGEVLVEEWCAW